ncbi:hypothetical protein E2C01_084898 [Portunus trituberculatus]|uniref:Uncharacterized protein n=1 Tax=Portunus trituberculatus TaxID=210409 RepID=A0A5B7JC46_PORTR|nr:hypothetical protein [Portunus trituberculatus]
MRDHNEGERGDGEGQVKRNMMRWTEIAVIRLHMSWSLRRYRVGDAKDAHKSPPDTVNENGLQSSAVNIKMT